MARRRRPPDSRPPNLRFPGSTKFARILSGPGLAAKISPPPLAATVSSSSPAPIPVPASAPPTSTQLTEMKPSSSSGPVTSPQTAAELVETKEAPLSPAAAHQSIPPAHPVSEISSAVAATDNKCSSSDVSPTPPQAAENKSSSTPLPWVSKFKASLTNLKQMATPTFLEDGTPVVVAPPSVLLKAAEMWKGHIIAQFHGLCPPAAKIFTDLNPIWGRYGDITVRVISETAALIFIPSIATREWVVEIGSGKLATALARFIIGLRMVYFNWRN